MRRGDLRAAGDVAGTARRACHGVAAGRSYTPGQVGFGTQTVTAAYGGDGGHTASSGQAELTVTLRTTTTVLACQRSLLVFQKCTATVSDTSPGSATAPTGKVSFSSSGRGVFSATHCTLSGTGTSAFCTVTYQPLAGIPFNNQTITASYGGDSTHQGSTGSTKLR